MKDERDLNGHLAVEEKRDGELRAREEPEPVQEESSGIGTEEVFEDIGKEKTGRRAGPTSEGEGGIVSLEKQFPKEPDGDGSGLVDMGHVSHVDEAVSSPRVGDDGLNEDHDSAGAERVRSPKTTNPLKKNCNSPPAWISHRPNRTSTHEEKS